MDKKYIIEQATAFSEELATAVRKLVPQMGGNFTPLTDDAIKYMLESKCNYLFVAKNAQSQEIVGMISLIIYQIPYVKKGSLEDLVVDEASRGHGIATQLLECAIAKAREEKIAYLDFTSQPLRESANKLYNTLGLERRDTNVYRLKLAIS